MEENKTLFDTSALIEIYKKNASAKGYTTIFNFIEFPKGAELGLKILFPTMSEYIFAYELSKKLLAKGNPVPAVDILIASIAFSRSLTIVTKDRHFLTIKKVLPKLKISFKSANF